MLIKAFFSEDIAHLSYMLIGANEIYIIDPQRHIDIYLEEAKNRNLPITGVLLTHPHADFISGHIELQKTTNARIYAHYQAPYHTDFHPVKENDEILLDHIRIKVLETPGHTPFCNSFVITDLSRGDEPVSVFTGDTLFVGDVGRPDLFPEKQEELAGLLYHSLFDKLFKLPDFVEVYPAHASGSMCGKNLSEKRATTIGYEKRFNLRAKLTDKKAFVQNILDDNLPVPEHFKYCAGINLKNPELLENLAPPVQISFEKFIQINKNENPIIIDIRKHWNWVDFHLDNSLSIDVNCLSFANYAGWLIPRQRPIILIHENENDLKRAVNSLRKIGLDQQIYYLTNGIQDFIYEDFLLASTPSIRPEEVLQHPDKYRLIDVRNNPPEAKIFNKLNYTQTGINEIFENKFDFSKDDQDVIICEKGALAAMIISFLEKNKISKPNYLLGSGRALQKFLNN